jgi:hypothetical protein
MTPQLTTQQRAIILDALGDASQRPGYTRSAVLDTMRAVRTLPTTDQYPSPNADAQSTPRQPTD